jgi:hypothetical protein
MQPLVGVAVRNTNQRTTVIQDVINVANGFLGIIDTAFTALGFMGK